jgi:phage shock protein PspC (stress-responsive transcriptional regulator)
MEKKLYRSKTDKKVAGVCGGLAKYLGIDITVVRLICLLACLFTGIGLVAYIVAALVIPEEPTVIEG